MSGVQGSAQSKRTGEPSSSATCAPAARATAAGAAVSQAYWPPAWTNRSASPVTTAAVFAPAEPSGTSSPPIAPAKASAACRSRGRRRARGGRRRRRRRRPVGRRRARRERPSPRAPARRTPACRRGIDDPGAAAAFRRARSFLGEHRLAGALVGEPACDQFVREAVAGRAERVGIRGVSSDREQEVRSLGRHSRGEGVVVRFRRPRHVRIMPLATIRTVPRG